MKLIISGHVPSKKNNWRPRAGGRGIRPPDRAIQEQIKALELDARRQWAGRDPLINPDISVQFFVSHFKGDNDNAYTTLLDVLKNAGVILNDNRAKFNGHVSLLPAIRSSEERTEIDIQE